MARLQWVILTERTIIEAQSNTVSLLSIVETVNLPPPPAIELQPGQTFLVPFRFYVNQQWARSDVNRGERVSGRVLLTGPNKKPYARTDFEVNLDVALRGRVIGQVMGFPYLGEGEYPIVVQVRHGTRWRTVGGTQFDVTLNAQMDAVGSQLRH